MMCVQLLVFILFLEKCSGVSMYIFSLNASEYFRMPPIYRLDAYDSCLQENDGSGVYCSVHFDLVTDETSDLHTMLTLYSEKIEIHFNHSKLTYGVCLTKTCKKFYHQDTTRDLVFTLEACLNETMWESYKLKTRIDKKINCVHFNKKKDINTYDVIVASLLGILLVLNLVGSLQEIRFALSNDRGRENSFLSCFSIRRNWMKLVAPGVEDNLMGLYGIKTLSIMMVIMFHALHPYIVNLDNVRDLEEAYTHWYYQLVANGTLLVQTFFVISGFLVSYNIQGVMQGQTKNKISSVFLYILLRWIRLTAAYLVTLAVTATWMRYFGDGPLWQTVVVDEVEDCQQNWWYHLLYINNYVDHSRCMGHSWYIASDFQLFCVGVLVLTLTSVQKRKLVLALLFVVGLLTPAVHTYLQNLDGHLLIKPETTRNLFILDPTFNNSYKRGHTNLASFIIGFSLGLLVCDWQTTDYKLHRYLRHRFTVWISPLFPICLLLVGGMFYRDAPRDSVYIRMLYAALARPLWGLWLSYIIIAMAFRYEDIFRSLLEWSGWIAPSRVSYCAYLLHMIIIKVLTANKRSLVHFSTWNLLETWTSTVTICFLAAVPLFLLVEAPVMQLIKFCTSGSNKKVAEDEKPNHELNKMNGDGGSKGTETVEKY